MKTATKVKLFLVFGFMSMLLVLMMISPFIVYPRIYHRIMTETWDMWLLITGSFALCLTTVSAIYKPVSTKKLKRLGRMLVFVTCIWAYSEYGFIHGAYFMSAFYISRLILTKTLPHVAFKYSSQ